MTVGASAARGLVRQHPLQRLPSPSRGASAVLHALGLASFAFSFHWLFTEPNPVSQSYGWHMQYLTIIGLSLSAVTFAIALLADLTGSPGLFRVKNALSVASAPMEVLISLLYWSMRTVDRSLVLSRWAPQLPLYADATFHLVPSVSLVLDLLLFSPPYTIAFLPAVGLSFTIAFAYWWWIERCFAFNNFYPYPIFAMLDMPQRVGLFASSALLMAVSTALLSWLYGVVNGRDMTTRPRSGNLKGE